MTVVSGKKRRITFVECNNDIYSMLDVAKIADLVLLMIGKLHCKRIGEGGVNRAKGKSGHLYTLIYTDKITDRL